MKGKLFLVTGFFFLVFTGRGQLFVLEKLPTGLTASDLSAISQQISPITQQAYLKASNTDPGDFFGYSVAVSGDTVVVAAGGGFGGGEDSNATGVNGDQNDNTATNSGAAYVFVRTGTNWTQQAYLKASNPDAEDRFGHSVAISGDTIVIGAEREDSNATGVDGNQSDNSHTNSGAAYVFVRTGTNWTQQAYLKASNTGVIDGFGWSVGISADTVIVGAPFEGSDAAGVNGNQTNDNTLGAGAAYVFVRSETNWTQQAYLKASNPDPSDWFGYSVAVSGDTLVVGTPFERSNATGVNSDQTDNSAPIAGAAYVFVRNGPDWVQQAYIKSSNTEAEDFFGGAVATSGDTIVVGARLEDSNATGVNGDQNNNSAQFSGAAYVFVRNGTNWSQQVYLKASNGEAIDYFGGAVAISGETIAIGAPGANAAYGFLRQGTNWSQQAYLQASNRESVFPFHDDQFGYSVAVSGITLIVGAYDEDSSATGVNGEQNNNNAVSAGAVYIFSGVGPTPVPAPSLAITQSSENLRVAWPLATSSYVLDQTSVLDGTTNIWRPFPLPYETNTTEFFITFARTNDQHYFRLRQP